MEDVTVADVARAVLTQVAPDELDRFPLVVDAFRVAPGAAGRAHRGGEQPTATGPMLAGETLSTLLLTLGVELDRFHRDRHGGGRWRRLWPRRASPDTVVPPLAESEVAAFRERAESLCRSHGRSHTEAVRLSTAYAAAIPRATKG